MTTPSQKVTSKEKKLNYKKMLEDILPIVEDDFCFDMDCHNLPNSKPFTQEEAMEMAKRIGRVYSIAHGLRCVCGNKYLEVNL